MPNPVLDVVVIGADTRQSGLTSRPRGRSYHPSRQCPVERGAPRGARHVRGRLSKVIPPYPRSNLRILSHAKQRMRASGTRRRLQCHRSVLSKAGAPCPRSTANPPAGTGPQLRTRGANRVQGSTGSINARWRRESGGGDTDQPEADNLRGSAEKSRPRTAQRREGHQALASERQQRRKPSRSKLDQGG